MTLLSQLKPRAGAKKNRKRVGRGEASGRGKTSTRGHKGQKSRSSAGIHPGFEGGQMPLHRRSPKWGFNQRRRRIFSLVNLGDLSARFLSGSEVGPEELMAKGLVRNSRLPVKILAKGELKHSLKISAHASSEVARAAIEKTGGSLTILAWKPKKTA